MFRMCRLVPATTVLVLVSILSLGGGGCSSPKEAHREPTPGAEKYVEDAREKLDSKQYTEARALLELAREAGAPDAAISSTTARLERDLAHAAMDEGDVARAFEHFSNAQEVEPDEEQRFEDLLSAIAAGRQAGRMPAELAPLASMAVDLKTSSKKAQRLAAQLWDDAGEPARALPYYAWLHKVVPDDTNVALRLASLYAAEAKPREAKRLYEKVYRAEPDNVVAALRLADIYDELGEHNEARALYERLVEAHPKRPSILMRYARFLQERGDSQRAREIQERAREAQPQRERRKMRELR